MWNYLYRDIFYAYLISYCTVMFINSCSKSYVVSRAWHYGMMQLWMNDRDWQPKSLNSVYYIWDLYFLLLFLVFGTIQQKFVVKGSSPWNCNRFPKKVFQTNMKENIKVLIIPAWIHIVYFWTAEANYLCGPLQKSFDGAWINSFKVKRYDKSFRS